MEPATDKQITFMRSLKIPARNGITKGEARLAIESALNKDEEKVEVVKVERAPWVKPEDYKSLITKPSGNGSMYTSYAKDIFCALFEIRKKGDITEIEELMRSSINLVKQAKEAFE